MPADGSSRSYWFGGAGAGFAGAGLAWAGRACAGLTAAGVGAGAVGVWTVPLGAGRAGEVTCAGAGGGVRGAGITTASPSWAAQASALGVPLRYVPSLQRIVEPAGGGVLAADVARSAAGCTAARVTAGGGAPRWGSTAARPRCVEQALAAAGGTMKVPSLHCATASTGGGATTTAFGRIESSGRPGGAGAARSAATGAGAVLTAPAAGRPAGGGDATGGGGTRAGVWTTTGFGGGGAVAGACAAAGDSGASRASANANHPARAAALGRTESGARRIDADGRRFVMVPP